MWAELLPALWLVCGADARGMLAPVHRVSCCLLRPESLRFLGRRLELVEAGLGWRHA